MKPGSNDILNDLVATTRNGKLFYEHAAARVESDELRTLFTRIARVKGDVVESLSDEVRTEGEVPAESGTWTGDFDRLYAEMIARLGDRDCAYVARLEESEGQLVKGYFKALDKPEPSSHAKTVINNLLPQVRQCHELMQAQKFALRRAA